MPNKREKAGSRRPPLKSRPPTALFTLTNQMKFSLCSKAILLGCALLAGCANRATEQTTPGLPAAGAPVFAQSLEPTLPESVSRVFNRSCRACHGPDGHGIAAVAPDLRRAKPRSFEQWKQYLGDPQQGHPGAHLSPPTWLSTDEVEIMASYLLSLVPPPAVAAQEVKKAAPTPVAARKRAKR
jgi:mono/diheme cytochrome c family protein